MTRVYINRFDRGIVTDPRTQLEGAFRYVGNMDIFSNPRMTLPYRRSESGDSAPTTSQKQNFCIALRTGTTYRIYSLGRQTALNRAEVLMKDLSTGGSTDLGDDGWATPSNNQSSVATPSFNLFVYYKKRNRIFGAEAGTTIFSFDPSSSASWGDESHSLSYTNIAQGLVHSKDDILYIPYDNKIAKNDNNSWSDTALTLPSHLYITSICEYGNYLAIACAPLSGVGESIVYLWDRDSSSSTLSDSCSFGEGTIKVLENVEGILIGIVALGNSSTVNNARISFKYYTQTGSAVKFPNLEIVGDNGTFQLLQYKQKINNRLYFQMSVTINGTKREGVWSIGRSSSGEPFAVVHERTPNNDTALTGGTLNGFFIVGDYVFQSYQDNGSFALSKTDNSENYSVTGTIETTINPKMIEDDRPKLKKIISAGLLYESLPTNGQAVLKYRVDDGSYTTVFTETTNSAVATEFPVSDEGRDIELKVEETGGAKISGIYYDYKPMETLI